jgi:two-component sensor histidine kinase
MEEAGELSKEASIHLEASEYVEGIKDLEQSVFIYHSLQKPVLEAISLLKTGEAYASIHLFDSAIIRYHDAIQLFGSQKNKRQQARAYRYLAAAYAKKEMFDSARIYYLKCQAMQEKVSPNLNYEIGNVYLKEKAYDAALRYFSKVEYLPNLAKNASTKSGKAHLQKGNLGKAEDYLMTSWLLNQDLETANLLGDLYTQKRDYEKAIYYLEKGYNQSEQKESELAEVVKNRNLLKRIYILKEEYSKSLDMAMQRNDTHQRFWDVQKKELDELLAIQHKINVANQSQVMDRQYGDVLYQFKANIASAISIFIGALFLGYAVLYKGKRTNTTKSIINHNHDRIKAIHDSVVQILSLPHHLEEPSSSEMLRDIRNRTLAIDLIEKRLDPNNYEVMLGEQFRMYLHDILQNLIDTHHYQNEGIDFQVEAVNIDPVQALPIGMICNELITNSFKYAYMDNPQPTLLFKIESLPEHKIKVTIADNGKGLSEELEAERKSTSGMVIMSDLIKDLKTNLLTTTNNGTTFEFVVPVHQEGVIWKI